MSIDASLNEQHVIPPELLKPPPRRVRWRMFPANMRVFFWRLGLFPLIIIGLALFLCGPIRTWVSVGARQYDGQVTEIRHIQGRRGRGRVMMTYSYTAGGMVHFGSRQIHESQVAQFSPPPGRQLAPVKVRAASVCGVYWDEVPLDDDGLAWPGCEAFALATGPGIMILFLTIASYRRHFSPFKKLYRTGSVASGHVVGKRTAKMNGRKLYKLDYEFEHPKFGKVKHFMDVSHSYWEMAREGNPVTVLFYPAKKQSVAYEFGDYVVR